MASGKLILLISKGEPIGTFIDLEPRLVSVGRQEGCTLRVMDLTVSRIHFYSWFNGIECWIRDSQSRNGTYVNGRRITASTLRAGDVINIGLSQLSCLEVGEAARLVARLSRPNLSLATDD